MNPILRLYNSSQHYILILKYILRRPGHFGKKHLFLIFLFAGFLSVACHEIVEVDLPKLRAKPIVNCLFTPDKPFKLSLSFAKEPADTTIRYISDAYVEINGNNGTKVVLEYTGAGVYSNRAFLPQRGVLYTLSVNITGFEEVTAEGRTPQSNAKVVSVNSKQNIKISPVMGTGEEVGIQVQRLDLAITNNIQTTEYYGISIIHNSIYYSTNDSIVEEKDRFQSGYLNSDDPSIINEGLENYESPLLMFKNNLSKEDTLTVSFDFEKNTLSKYQLHFFQFSTDAFWYLKSWIIHDYTKDYDFWEVYEPLPLYSNIENGYGIFAGYSSQTYPVYPDSTIIFN